MTIKEMLEAKLTVARAEVSKLEADMAAAVAAGEGWVEKEVDAVKAFFVTIGHHLGL